MNTPLKACAATVIAVMLGIGSSACSSHNTTNAAVAGPSSSAAAHAKKAAGSGGNAPRPSSSPLPERMPSSTPPVPMDPVAGQNVAFMSAGVIGGKVAALYGDSHVKLGQTMVIKVLSDVSDEVHVHGYNFMKEISPGAPVAFQFTANIPGEFEVELENSHLKLFTFDVQ